MNAKPKKKDPLSCQLKILKKRLPQTLTKSRYQHSLRAAGEAESIARLLGLDTKLAYFAGLIHDIARELPDFLAAAKKYSLRINALERKNPVLLHGRLGAAMLRRDFQIKDKLLLKSVEHHTLGARRMSKLEQIVYVADFICEARDFPQARIVRDLLYSTHNLQRAVEAKAYYMIQYARKKKWPIHPVVRDLAKRFPNHKG